MMERLVKVSEPNIYKVAMDGWVGRTSATQAYRVLRLRNPLFARRAGQRKCRNVCDDGWFARDSK
jgi:hypothetical protein